MKDYIKLFMYFCDYNNLNNIKHFSKWQKQNLSSNGLVGKANL